MAESNEAQGWRPEKAKTGVVIDVGSGQTVARGLAMPHSPRWYDGRLWVLDSGRGALAIVDPQNGTVTSVAELPGYTRGLSLWGPFAFVGLSRIRETAVFGGVPIAERRQELKCGVGVVDLRTGQAVAALQFQSGVEEIFDVQVVPNARCPAVVGPVPSADDTKPVWVVPNVDQVARLSHDDFQLGVAHSAPTNATAGRPLPAVADLPTEPPPSTEGLKNQMKPRVGNIGGVGRPAPSEFSRPARSANDDAIALFNQGNQHLRDDRFAEAAELYRRSIAASPQMAIAHTYLGVASHYLLRFDDARTSFEKALDIDSELVDAQMGLCMLLLHTGEFERGWEKYEWRWQCDGFEARPTVVDAVAKAWDGSPLEDKTILVYPEQGVGDDVMFASCLPELTLAAKRCIVLTRPRLVPLFARSFPSAEIHPSDTLHDANRSAALGPVDFQVAAGSLPRFLRPGKESFPDRRAFLIPDPTKLRQWKERLAELGPEPKIGVSWRGGALPQEVRRRSIPLDHWQPILTTPGLQFVNLQYGQCLDELKRVHQQLGVSIRHWEEVDALDDMETFAAQVAALDLVISIDNSTVHLAGALGVDVWMLSPPFSASGWRWLVGRENSLWYPSLRIFRQQQMGDWNTVLKRVTNELRAVAGLPTVPLPPTKGLATANSPSDSNSDGVERPVPSESARSLAQQGLLLHRQRRVQEAIEFFRRAITLFPNSAELHNHLGNALQDANDQDAALESYHRALAADDKFVPALQNLGFVLVNHGRLNEGRPHLEKAQRLQPADINRVLLATSLPVVYQSVQHLHDERQRMVADVRRLVDDGVSIDTSRSTVTTNFFCAYQGFNDRELQSDLGKLYRGVDLCTNRHQKDQGERIKIGFLSDHFCDHTIGRLNVGAVTHLPREQFEVTVLSIGRHSDSLAEQFRRGADRFIDVPNSVEAARQAIAGQGLDILMFTDVGMHYVIYTLAFSRMAPVQCATWGHPVTTGSPAIDYFLSSEQLDTADADQHYTEQLVRLPRVGVYYNRPQLTGPPRDRAYFGLDENRHIYLCPQTLFKFHPKFDQLLAGILRRDPLGELLLIEGRVPCWAQLLHERLARSMPDVVARVRFIQPMPNSDLLHLNALADVALDTIHFGGGNTSYEAFAVGLPVVTWPSNFMRGRITHALYNQMQIRECTADSAEQYVELAVTLGTDRDYNQTIRNKILTAGDAIFEDNQAIEALAKFFQTAAPNNQHIEA